MALFDIVGELNMSMVRIQQKIGNWPYFVFFFFFKTHKKQQIIETIQKPKPGQNDKTKNQTNQKQKIQISPETKEFHHPSTFL
jgi:hypothetical protein